MSGRGAHARPKEAAKILKKRVSSRNPRVQLLALELIDTALGKCGLPFQNAVATSQFMQALVNVINTREPGHEVSHTTPHHTPPHLF